ncbi:MAG: RpiB/LacA/LacB family sugar-phosphate isomerase [Patescibacteria group bacterium]|nr:RpiB/LacA/LacB family sugar-phosphate isomerase [Patescibacteria group bacterium]
MKLYFAADHGGFELKQQLIEYFQEKYEVIDLGADHFQEDDDYPDLAAKLARILINETDEARGILLCRSGGGMAIVANKIAGIRAVDIFDEKSARHARADNKANVISLGADWLNLDQAIKAIETFLQTRFSQEPRHIRRIKKIAQLEKK